MATSVGSGLLEDVFNHIALPARLPGRKDAKLGAIEENLLGRLIKATKRFAPLPGELIRSSFETLHHSLLTSKRVNAGGRLTKISLLNAFKELQGDHFIIIHVSEQNAALIVRQQQWYSLPAPFHFKY